MNYFLVLHNHPPVIVHEEDRKEYYNALEEWDRKQNLDAMAGFLKGQTEKTWGFQIDRPAIREKEKNQGEFL